MKAYDIGNNTSKQDKKNLYHKEAYLRPTLGTPDILKQEKVHAFTQTVFFIKKNHYSQYHRYVNTDLNALVEFNLLSIHNHFQNVVANG